MICPRALLSRRATQYATKCCGAKIEQSQPRLYAGQEDVRLPALIKQGHVSATVMPLPIALCEASLC